VLKQAKSLGMTTVIWDVRAPDWARPGVSVIINRILERATNGAIILLHDGGGDRSETVAALPKISVKISIPKWAILSVLHTSSYPIHNLILTCACLDMRGRRDTCRSLDIGK